MGNLGYSELSDPELLAIVRKRMQEIERSFRLEYIDPSRKSRTWFQRLYVARFHEAILEYLRRQAEKDSTDEYEEPITK